MLLPPFVLGIMYLENVSLHGGPAPALPSILPMTALKESESAVDHGTKFLTTYLPIIAFSSVLIGLRTLTLP